MPARLLVKQKTEKRKMKSKIIITLLILVLAAPACWAANRIAFCDFEDLPEESLGTGDLVDYGIDFASYSFAGTGGVDSGGVYATNSPFGKVAKAYIQNSGIDGHTRTMPRFSIDNSLNNSKEVYIKFDLKIDPSLGTSNANREILKFKFARISDAAVGFDPGEWMPNITLEPSSSSYTLYTWSTGSGYAEYYCHRATTKLPNHLMDNQWHTMEVYINIGNAVVSDKYDDSADGIVRIWEDGVLILEDEKAPFRTSAGEGQGINSTTFISHTNLGGAPVQPTSGSIYYDNVEVWDGMPDEEENPVIYSGEVIDEDTFTDKAEYYKRDDDHVKLSVGYQNGDAAVNNVKISVDIYKNDNLIREDARVNYLSLGANESITRSGIRFPIQSKGNFSFGVKAEVGDQLLDEQYIDFSVR